MEKTLTKKFTPLKEDNGSYLITHKRKFHPIFDVNEYVKDSVVWAGNGDSFKDFNRGRNEKVRNAIQGKLGEFALYKYLKSRRYDINPPDLRILPRGQWDSGDLLLGNQKIQIKTGSHFSNLLLLRKKDWDSEGNYRFNTKEDTDPYTSFFLCRIKPGINEILTDFDPMDINKTLDILSNVNFRADIPGFVYLNDFKKIIHDEQYIRSGSKIGSRDISDDHYYFQSGDLRDINEIPFKK